MLQHAESIPAELMLRSVREFYRQSVERMQVESFSLYSAEPNVPRDIRLLKIFPR